jgi:hypothetical protein
MNGYSIETTPREIVVHIERNADESVIAALHRELDTYFYPFPNTPANHESIPTNDWIDALESVTIPTLAATRIDREFLYDAQNYEQRLYGDPQDGDTQDGDTQ